MTDTRHAVRVSRPPTLSSRARDGLNLLRALSALYIVGHHVTFFTPSAPPVVKAAFFFGQEAVICFFLLSGMVIFANEQHRATSPRGYYLRRLRRIYPGIVVAVLVSATCWRLGLVDVAPSGWSLVGTLLGLQDLGGTKPGVVVDPFLGNAPLWSLSYEMFFYAIFPLLLRAWLRWPDRTRTGIGVVSCVAYATYLVRPDHLSLVLAYVLVWWTGAMLISALLSPDGVRLRTVSREVVALTALTAVAGVGTLVYPRLGTSLFPELPMRHFAAALVLTLLFSSPLRSAAADLATRWARACGFVASISYGLYVLHYPLLAQPGWLTKGVAGVAAFVACAFVLVGLAWVVDRVLPRLLPRAPSR